MTRNKVFLIAQALLCVLAAALLAGGALSLYFEGAAKQAEGDLFNYIFTREKAAAKLLPVLPVVICILGLSAAGRILGIRDGNADKPVHDAKLLRDMGSIREKAAGRQAGRKIPVLRAAVLGAALLLIILGILNGGLEDVLAKGAAVCTECIGLG